LRLREKLFWLCVGAALIVLFLSIIPSHYEICEATEKTKEEHCTSYQVAQFLGIKIAQFLDVHNWLVTALFAGLVTLFTWRLWQATYELRVSTDSLWDAGNEQRLSAEGIAKRQSDDTKKSIAIAQRSATVAENALVATDRAWVSIKAKIIGPLTFKDGYVAISVKFDMTNVGKSPATHAELFATLCPDLIEARNSGTEATQSIGRELFDYGVVLFPTDISDRVFYLRLPIEKFKERIAKAIKLIADSKSVAVPMTVANPAIMVCAYYRLAGVKKDHHTIILFEIQNTDITHLGWDGSDGETHPAALKLVQTFMGGQVT
jgi:hypothetical protein